MHPKRAKAPYKTKRFEPVGVSRGEINSVWMHFLAVFSREAGLAVKCSAIIATPLEARSPVKVRPLFKFVRA